MGQRFRCPFCNHELPPRLEAEPSEWDTLWAVIDDGLQATASGVRTVMRPAKAMQRGYRSVLLGTLRFMGQDGNRRRCRNYKI